MRCLMFDVKLLMSDRSGCLRSARASGTSTIKPPTSNIRRTGVTLIELMLVITIIATLSAAFLGASRSAMEHANAARTKSTIAKLNGLLMERWASYATRRVDVSPVILNDINTMGLNPVQRGQMLADVRLLATRELMKFEMPDRWSNILMNPVGGLGPEDQPKVLSTFPSLQKSYLRRYNQIVFNKPPGTGTNTQDIIENQGAECLYMIIMLATGDGEARTLFNQQDIGDTDDDGAPEFLDGWGRPIHFIRWPAGFVSDLQPIDPVTNLHNADADHDPMDPFHRDQPSAPGPPTVIYPIPTSWIAELRDPNPAYRLVPLIYSAGSDGETDIDDLAFTGSGTPFPSSFDPVALDPSTPSPGSIFVPVVNDYNYVFGFPFDKNDDGDDNSLDNIHNHLQDGR